MLYCACVRILVLLVLTFGPSTSVELDVAELVGGVSWSRVRCTLVGAEWSVCDCSDTYTRIVVNNSFWFYLRHRLRFKFRLGSKSSDVNGFRWGFVA